VSEGVRDLAAVAKDRVRRKRKRDLGIREAKRLVRDAHDSLKNLLAMVSGEGGGGEPAAKQGAPEA
jgi:RNA polymerase-interacting CarD/CdnL/TRCF family regulator